MFSPWPLCLCVCVYACVRALCIALRVYTVQCLAVQLRRLSAVWATVATNNPNPAGMEAGRQKGSRPSAQPWPLNYDMLWEPCSLVVLLHLLVLFLFRASGLPGPVTFPPNVNILCLVPQLDGMANPLPRHPPNPSLPPRSFSPVR